MKIVAKVKFVILQTYLCKIDEVLFSVRTHIYEDKILQPCRLEYEINKTNDFDG